MGNGDKGMARRASAASSVPPQAAARVHRSNESHHGFVGTHPTNAGLPAYTPGGAAGSPQGKVVLALIRRLTEKVRRERFVVYDMYLATFKATLLLWSPLDGRRVGSRSNAYH